MKCYRAFNLNSMRDPNSMFQSNKMLHELSEERVDITVLNFY